MLVFSKDPDVADQQMVAIIYYLVTFGYIDGRFDLSEQVFIREHIRKLVGWRVDDLRIGDARIRLDITDGTTARFETIYEQIAAEVKALFDEVTARGEDVAAFVRARLTVKCYELFRAFDAPNQAILLHLVDRLIIADGVTHQAEQALRDELLHLLQYRPPADTATRDIGQALQVTAPLAMTPAMDDHPLLSHLEKHFARDPIKLGRQLTADYALLTQTAKTWDDQRVGGLGRLAGRQRVAELDGKGSFLDGYVHFIDAAALRSYDVTVLGDLHGCYSNLKAALLQANFFRKVHAYRKNPLQNPFPLLVLLGDYIDRGRFGFDGVLRTAMQLYVSMPEHVVLLRGNHEWFLEYNGKVQGGVRPAESLATLEPLAPQKLLLAYRALFERMPSMLIMDRTLFVHAGIPSDDVFAKKLGDLSGLNDGGVRFQMMWSDPTNGPYVPAELQRVTSRFCFGRQQFRGFMSRIGCRTMIRGHERVASGFVTNYDEGDLLLITLFSAGGAQNADV
ncbi:MAG TPA: metallophosphoesterase family protein, partial [Haliangiales bacterium]|nr:metallophosphoesterase family protein [Haliangiales bacterium]